MTDPAAPTPPRWRFRLQVITGAALLVLAIMVLRARAERSGIATRRAAVEGALRDLVIAQEEHYAQHGRYASRLDDALAWRAPSAVTVTLTAVGDESWRAVASDSSLAIPPTTCGVYLGTPAASPHRAVIDPGVVGCW